MDAKQVRLVNLKCLIKEAGTAVSLARQAGTDAAYISQLVKGVASQAGKPRTVGDDLARRLEKAMEKPYGWLDRMHHDGAPSAMLQVEFSQVPLLSWSTDVESDAAPQVIAYISAPVPAGLDTFALKIEDERMLPEFSPGEVVVVDRQLDAELGKFVVVDREGENHLSFGKLSKINDQLYLQPLSEKYSARAVSEGDVVCGVVIYKGKWY